MKGLNRLQFRNLTPLLTCLHRNRKKCVSCAYFYSQYILGKAENQGNLKKSVLKFHISGNKAKI